MGGPFAGQGRHQRKRGSSGGEGHTDGFRLAAAGLEIGGAGWGSGISSSKAKKVVGAKESAGCPLQRLKIQRPRIRVDVADQNRRAYHGPLTRRRGQRRSLEENAVLIGLSDRGVASVEG